MTQEEKAKRYDEALERAKGFRTPELKDAAEHIFPELKESEDEKIREQVVYAINQLHVCECTKNKLIAWLEKQDEQKPTDKVEPKFNVGDWIVYEGLGTYKVVEIHEGWYSVIDNNDRRWSVRFSTENLCHIWTIQEAKNGDVLAFDNDTIVIFKDLYNSSTFHSYCHIEDGLFDVSKDDMPDWWEGEGFRPATKEQRDTFFVKMKEAGYEWDDNKKELNKIKQESTWNEKIKGLDELETYILSLVPDRSLDAIKVDAKNIRHIINKEQKPAEWSDDDEKFFKTALWHISYSVSNGKSTDIHCDTTDWLKSLKPIGSRVMNN